MTCGARLAIGSTGPCPVDQARPSRAGRCAPVRLHRTRKARNATPPGAVYVGRPTIFGNPFAGRPKVGHARSVILYGHWLGGDLSPRILRSLGFSEYEIEALGRWRRRALAALPGLAGRDLQCWCPLSSAWCHADTFLRLVNGGMAGVLR